MTKSYSLDNDSLQASSKKTFILVKLRRKFLFQFGKTKLHKVSAEFHTECPFAKGINKCRIVAKWYLNRKLGQKQSRKTILG